MEYFLAFYLGAMFGSYFNVIKIRGLKNSCYGRSVCTDCGNQLKWYHNIPIFSFIFLKGRCGFCDSKIKKQYIIFEFAVGFVFLIITALYFNFLLYL
jgi:leader peptidase (prepilin peptidase)/N-methyltransferase